MYNKIKEYSKKIFGLSPQETNGAFLFVVLLSLILLVEKEYIQYRRQQIADIKIEEIKERNVKFIENR